LSSKHQVSALFVPFCKAPRFLATFPDTLENKENIKPTTIDSLWYIRNRFENFKPDADLGDVTVSFLKKFSRKKISSMLVHSIVIITEHYIDGLDPDSTFKINSAIQ